MAYCVIRTDGLSGTKQPADLRSLRFYGADGNPAAVENGTIVKLQGLEDGQREIYKAVAATASDDLNDCVVVGGVELPYDERLKNLDQYINEAGEPVRGYILRSRNQFSITKDGFVGGTVPAAKGAKVGVGTGGKLDTTGTNFGECSDIETAGRYTYYTITIGKTEAAAASSTVTPGSGD